MLLSLHRDALEIPAPREAVRAGHGHTRLPSAALAGVEVSSAVFSTKYIAANSQNRGLLFPFSKHQKDLEHLPMVTLLPLPPAAPLPSRLPSSAVPTLTPGEELRVIPPVLFHIM